MTAVLVSGRTVELTLDPAVVASDVVVVSYTPGTNPVQDSEGADAGTLTNEEVTNNTPPDPPLYKSGVVDGYTLTLTYDEDLDLYSQPEPSAYTVTVNGSDPGVSSVYVNGKTVELDLSTPVLARQTVELSYAPPSTYPLQDLLGEDAAPLNDVRITNNTDVPPSLVSTNDSAVVDGDTLTLTYNEPLKETSQPAATAYTVTVDTVDREVTGVLVSGSTVTLTLVSAVVGGETVLVSYDSSQAVNVLQDSSGTQAEDFTNRQVTNITNNAPVFTTPTLTVAENTQVVGTVVAEDPDIHDNVTYILKAADPEDDGRKFLITSAGELSFREAHVANFEHPGSVDDNNVYRVTVMAMSGGGDRELMTIEQITVTITDVDEDGRLLLSSEQPQAGTPLLANVDDPDGSVSGVTWTWAISSDRTNWDPIASSEITAAGSAATYVPDAADVGRYLRITADYTDPLGSADQVQRALPNAVRAAPGSNSAPVFPLSEMGQRSVPEETAPNVNIGLPVIATDADSDLLTYSLSSPGGSDDAESFDIIPLSGQLRTDAVLDFETKSSYEVVVTATDPSGETAEITVTITVTDVTEQNWNTPGTTNPGGGGGGGGGGIPFIGGGGPTPSVEDYGWNVTGDIDPLASRNGDATGLWGDEHTLRVGQNGDGTADGVFAYDRSSGDRLQDLEFEIHETNRAPRGVWSDGETMWVSDSGQERLFAYDLESGERIEDAEFALSSRNRGARGIWSDGVSMWVLDGGRDALFRYDLASGQSLGEFDLDSDNGDPHGVWSDGTAIWVSDAGARKIFAYHQRGQGLMREADEDFDGLMGAGNNSPRGIWSDGDLMYVVDAYDDKIYTYNMPDAFDARLASLSLSDVDIGEFSGLRTEYTGIPEDDATETTVAAVAVQDDATIVIVPDDVDENARDGHQVALDGTAVTVCQQRSDSDPGQRSDVDPLRRHDRC